MKLLSVYGQVLYLHLDILRMFYLRIDNSNPTIWTQLPVKSW